MSTTTVPSPDEPDAPRAAWGHSPRPPSLHFVAGLPRSGATMLMSLLHQNPRIHAAPTSGLGLVFHELRERWTRNPYHAETPRDDARDRCLRALLTSYHETDRELVLDKQRMWIAAIPDLERLLGRPVRLLVPVRAVVDIVASFEALRGRQGAFLPNVDRALGPSSTAPQRARYYLAPDGAIGAPLAQLQTAVASGFADRMLFIDYDQLMSDPPGQLARIYAFLGEPPFAHDLERIPDLGPFDSRPLGLAGLHDVRRRWSPTRRDPRAILGDELVSTLERDPPWAHLIGAAGGGQGG